MCGILDTYTVSFFGHRRIEEIDIIEKAVCELVHKLLSEKEYVNFLVGRDGEFDLIVSACIKRQQKEFRNFNSSLVWVMPYNKAEYRRNMKNYDNYYDEIEICESSSEVHYKKAISIRNRKMIDRSDFVIFYVRNKFGGAYQAMNYAKSQGKNIINIDWETEKMEI